MLAWPYYRLQVGKNGCQVLALCQTGISSKSGHRGGKQKAAPCTGEDGSPHGPFGVGASPPRAGLPQAGPLAPASGLAPALCRSSVRASSWACREDYSLGQQTVIEVYYRPGSVFKKPWDEPDKRGVVSSCREGSRTAESQPVNQNPEQSDEVGGRSLTRGPGEPSGEQQRPVGGGCGGWQRGALEVLEDPAFKVGLKLCPEHAGPAQAAPGCHSSSRSLSFPAAD